MRIALDRLLASYEEIHAPRRSPHTASDRRNPSVFQYDYLVLHSLASDVRQLLARLPAASGGVALDVGCDRSPYRTELSTAGFAVRTLDLTTDRGADYAGTAEATGLPSDSFDLVLCTQVLEHCSEPWVAMREISRILKKGGHCVFSAPHVWFFHPHPGDFWRFTQQGIVRLCEEGGLVPVEMEAQGGTLLAVCQILAFAAYGVLGRFGAPLYALANFAGAALDPAFPNALFSLNFACLARKP